MQTQKQWPALSRMSVHGKTTQEFNKIRQLTFCLLKKKKLLDNEEQVQLLPAEFWHKPQDQKPNTIIQMLSRRSSGFDLVYIGY